MTDALVGRVELRPHVQRAMAGRLQVPANFPAEVTSALRGLVLAGHISDPVAVAARRRLATVRMRLHLFGPYADRIWELRDNLTVYDAWYLAVAERMDQSLLTADAAILGTPGVRCQMIDARV